MKTICKQLCALLCAGWLLLLPAFAAEGERSFPDVSEHSWYYESVTYLADHGRVDGFPDGGFHPEGTLTKAELTKLLFADAVSEPGEECWWQPYFLAALETGVLTEADEADMGAPVDRLRTAQMLAALLDRNEAESLPKIDGLWVTEQVGDFAAIPEDCTDAVVTVYGLGLIQGFDDGCFHGEALLTRAQGAAILQRLLMPEKRTPVWLPEPEAEAEPEPIKLSDVLFLGNSFCAGLAAYSGQTEPDFLSCNGGGVYSAKSATYVDKYGGKWSLSEYLALKPYRLIVLIYGTNEMGFDIDYLRERFHEFLDMVEEAQPDALLRMTNAPPVNEDLISSEQFTNKTCRKINRLIQEVADERGIEVIDLWSYLADSGGSLPAKKTVDGIHLTAQTYQSWSDWMLDALPVLRP